MKPGMEPRRQAIPVMLLVKTAFQLLWQQRDDALRLGLVPTLLLFGGFIYVKDAVFAFADLMQQGMPSEVPPELAVQFLVFALIEIVAACLVTVNWLRFLLLGPMGAVGLGLGIGGAHLRFLLAVVALGLPLSFVLALVLLPLTLLPGALSALAILLVFIAVLVLAARVLPYITGLAIGQPMTLVQSLTVSRGNALPLAISLVLVHLPFGLGLEILQRVLALVGFTSLAPVGSLFIVSVVLVADWICQASVLATAHRHMVGVRV